MDQWRLQACAIAWLGLALAASTGGAAPPSDGPSATTAPASRPGFLVGRVDDRTLAELSGLAASRRHAGVLWAHNDSGSKPALYAMTRDGHVTARVPVVGASNEDWEDMAVDEGGRLYVADVGNNQGRRREVVVYRFDEPDPRGGDAARQVRPAGRWVLRYPGQPFDCEAMFVHGGHGYLVSKRRDLGSAELYRFPLEPAGGRLTLERVGALPVRAPVTAADVSADGRWVVVLTVAGPHAFRVDGDVRRCTTVAPAGSFLFVSPLMEAACFVQEGVLAGTEPGELMLFRWEELGIKDEG